MILPPVFLKKTISTCMLNTEKTYYYTPQKKHALVHLGGFFLHPMRSGSRKSTNDRKGMTRGGTKFGLLELVSGLSHEIDFKNFDKKLHNLA